jgi:sugar O-acyltransferase (sialic acid O-acetyltransferase NeuD family)
MEVIVQNKRLLIIGAGGFGREIEDWLEIYPSEKRDWTIGGYIDDNPDALTGFKSKYIVLGGIKDFHFTDNDYGILAIADPDIKEKIYCFLKSRIKFLTFIHPSVIIGSNVEIGEGTILYPNTIISTNCRIGRLVSMGCGNHIGHDTNVGDYSSFMASIDIGGGTVIGSKVYIGTKATVVPKRKIVDSVKISSGSVVINNIHSVATYFGNPAHKI